MKVKFKNYPNTNFTEEHMEDFAQDSLDGSDYGNGMLGFISNSGKHYTGDR